MTEKTMRLYRVTTVTQEYHGCKDVTFSWFYADKRTPRRPYAELIEDYKNAGRSVGYAEFAIDELFTEQEAKQLAAYLDREHGHNSVTTIEEQKLPIPNNWAGLSAMAVGGGDDFYMLHKESNYSLPFVVEGYFDLVGCELVDGSGVYHHRLMLLSADGKARMQTNEEAAAMSNGTGYDS